MVSHADGPVRTLTGTSDRVRAAREQISHSHAAAPEFEYDLLRIFVRNELRARITIPLLASIIALSTMFWAPMVEASIWLAAVLGAHHLLLGCCQKFDAQNRNTVDVAAWRKALVTSELLYGVCWAGIAVVGLDTANHSSHVFVFASLIVVLTIRLMFASTVIAIVCAGTIPMTAAVVMRLVQLGDPFYFAMAFMAVGVHVYFLFLAKGMNSTVIAMLELRAEKDLLIADLEEAKSFSDGARRKAEAANLAKSRFLATMSHELRTPLNAIIGFSDVMRMELMGPIGNDRYRDYCGSIHDSGQHLLQLINQILDLSRIESGRHELRESRMMLAPVVGECLELQKLRIDGKNLRVIEQFNSDISPIWADQRAIRQIVLNLLSNAIKFTPNGGTITVSVSEGDEGAQILCVRDNGPGIPKHELATVMQSFGQGSLAHETAEGGTGLGLPIVKSLVELHGGKFVLKSALRKGTLAMATFPRNRTLRGPVPQDNSIGSDHDLEFRKAG